jgi:putative ABC transport system permease protein
MRDWKSEVSARLRGMNLTPEREMEIIEELSQHLEDRYQELLARGVQEPQAYQTAIEELQVHELIRNLRRSEKPYVESVPLGSEKGGSFFGTVWQDIRYAGRVLRLNPAFTLVAVASLALGIGANTAIFQLLDAVRLRTLPVSKPGELAIIKIGNMKWRQGRANGRFADLTNPLWEQIRDRQEGFSGTFAFGLEPRNMASGGPARYARVLWMGGDGFNVLGLAPVAGRFFTKEEDHRGCGGAGAVLSYPFWQREFGGERSAIGKNVTLEGHPFEIIGVTPPGFFGLEVGTRFDVAMPICAEPIVDGPEDARLDVRHHWWLSAMGRLKPGWTLEKATAQLEAISPSILEATIPPVYKPESVKKYQEFRFAALPGATGVSSLRSDYESPLWLLLGIAALVLIIACANLANLMLARAGAREREIAVRLALGASRGRLVRQLLTESLLLAAMGATIGFLLARLVSASLVRAISTSDDSVFMSIGLDWRMFAFTAGLAVFTCVLFGLAPAIRASSMPPKTAMSAAGRSMTAGREGFSLRRMLVVSQVALSLVLLVGALLFARSLYRLTLVDAGFQADGLLITDVDFSRLNIPPEKRNEYMRQMLDRIRSVPGLENSATTNIPPMSGSGWNQMVAGASVKEATYLSRVSPGYFRVFSTPLLAGRDFTDHDDMSAPKVAIVNETFVRKYLGGTSPLGKTFQLDVMQGSPQFTYEVVGVVKDTKYYELKEENLPIAFFPVAQDDKPYPGIELVVRSDRTFSETTADLRRAMAAIDPGITIDYHVLKTQIRDGLLRERLMATLSGLFGGLAALLATVGLYGVISYMVIRRTNEIGIRMALGADRRMILSMIMREAGTLLSVGIAIGIVLALAGARAASSLLFGLRPHDPPTIAIAVFSLAAVAALASFLPARRAASLDPMVALRDE